MLLFLVVGFILDSIVRKQFFYPRFLGSTYFDTEPSKDTLGSRRGCSTTQEIAETNGYILLPIVLLEVLIKIEIGRLPFRGDYKLRRIYPRSTLLLGH